MYSDRTNFSKTAFPHVNVSGPGTPAWLCLHRGSIDTWFAEHTVVDLVERARRWLRETARNRLVPEGDGFEPTRAIDTLGTFYHPPGDNLGRILDHWKAHGGGAGHAVTSFDLLDDESMAEIGTTGVRGPAGRVRLVGVLR